MNAARVHLLSAHVPVCAVGFGLLLWLAGVVRASVDFRRAAFLLFLLAGLLGGLAYGTGRPAWRALENRTGWNARAVRQHEEVAVLALASTSGLGLAALAALFWQRKAARLPRGLSGLLLGLALVSGVALGWTSALGGRVSHPEIVLPGR